MLFSAMVTKQAEIQWTKIRQNREEQILEPSSGLSKCRFLKHEVVVAMKSVRIVQQTANAVR